MALILGSSHVVHFNDYVKKHELSDFNLDNPPPVYFYGVSGGRVTSSSHCRKFLDAIASHHISLLIVHLGGNDLDSNEDVETIILRLVSFLTMCANKYNVNVSVLQFMPRQKTRILPVKVYNCKVINANCFLKQTLCSSPRIFYCKIKGSQNSNIVDKYGVHLSPSGMLKYYRCVRGVLTKYF